ncbi:MAG TPA: ATP-binding protein [Xanthomonadales bacterium]|nr:ATP-binding protein [Xanthomonadales bacterium]
MFCAWALAWQAGAPAYAQQAPVFRVYGTEQGLPSRQVHALAQDFDGRLWIGTANGLVRFDGHEFIGYPARLEQSNALASTSVEALAIDAAGQVWVATEGGRLARWRPLTDDFERIDLGLAQAEQLEVWALATLGQRTFAGTYGAGLLELDAGGQTTRQYAVPQAMGGPHVLDLLADEASLWAITLERHLLHFDADHGSFSEVTQESGQPLANAYGLGLRHGELWFSTRDGMLCTLSPEHRARCAALPLLALPARARMLLSGSRGDWVGGMGELLHSVDDRPRRDAFQPGRLGGVPQQALWTALADRDSGLWFGSNGGGLLHLPVDADRFRVWQPDLTGGNGLRDGRVRGIEHDAAGRVWIATLNAGLHRMRSDDGSIEAVALPGSEQRRVWSVLAAGSDALWVGHQDGLQQLTIAPDGTLQLQRQWPADALAGGMIDLLHRDREGQIWAASMGAGINRIDPASGTVVRHLFAQQGLIGTEVQQIGEGADRRTWVATDRGLYAFDPACTCWQALIAESRVDAYSVAAQQIHAFVDGQLVGYHWREGLFRDEAFAPRAFVEFQTIGGMTSVDGALWLAGPQGLYRYRPQSGRLDAWDTRDGLPTREFSDRPLHVDQRGNLWIGSEDGLVSVDPRQVLAQTPAARLRFDRLSVDGPGGTRSLPAAGHAQLSPDDRELHAVVRLSTLSRPHAQRFSFRLVGLEDWSAPVARPERRLGTLKSGDYVLEVRAWDGYGQPAAATLSWPFRVLPPWWSSRGAWFAYLLLLALGVGAIELWRRRRRLAMQVLAETRRQAQWAERSAAEKTALVAELSHEIRNPLNGVLGMGRLLAEQPLSPAAQRYLSLLLDAGRQLARLLDDMLDWSRLQARAAPLPLQPVHLVTALQSLLDRYGQAARERQLDFDVAIGPALTLQADPPRLQQIVENLLSNALKFTSRGAIRISAVEQGTQVQLRIHDSGPGMSAAELERLFRPFERVGDERAAPGTGLGLAISRSLAERMAGSLSVESEPGVGSCFILTLGLAAAVSSEPAAEKVPASAEMQPLAGRKLLVVDDDALGREVLEHELGARGALVCPVGDALSALIRVHQQPFDAALIDWDLPGMSGVELARSLRLQLPALPLVAVTGRATPDDLALSIEVGFAAHLAKPVDPQRLVATVLVVIGASSSTGDR